MTDSDDELLPLLKPHDALASNEKLFAETMRILQRRAMIRRIAKMGGLVAVFAIGIAIGWFAKPTPVVEAVKPAVVVDEAPQDGSSTYVALTPDQIEQKAELADDRGEAGKYYKLAGDAYLARQRYDEAARCYRLFVNMSRDTDLGKDDSWLLCSVKITTQKETKQ